MTATRREESLLEALSRVPDPRGRQGRRYELASVLAMAVCAMACGARSLYAIAQWGRQHRQLVCEALGIKRLTTPSHPQLHRIFAALEVQAFEAVLESLDLKGQIVTGDALFGPAPMAGAGKSCERWKQ